MIESLHIKNFILIEELNIEFKEGFSAFIGESARIANGHSLKAVLPLTKGSAASWKKPVLTAISWLFPVH